jgi:hypothetical protein
MTFALHYRAMTHSNIYCIRIYSSVLEVQEPYVPGLHNMAVKSESPPFPATALISRQALSFIKWGWMLLCYTECDFPSTV